MNGPIRIIDVLQHNRWFVDSIVSNLDVSLKLECDIVLRFFESTKLKR